MAAFRQGLEEVFAFRITVAQHGGRAIGEGKLAKGVGFKKVKPARRRCEQAARCILSVWQVSGLAQGKDRCVARSEQRTANGGRLFERA